MSDPVRLLRSETSLEAELLRAGVDETPPPHAREKVLAALGLAAAASAIATTTSGVGAGAIGGNASSTVAVMSKLAVAKWSLAVALVGAAGGAGYAVHRANEPVVAPRTASVPAATTASVVASASVPTPQPVESIVSEPIVPPPPVVAKAPKAAAPVVKKSLSDEVAVIDRARSALAAKQYAAALEALDEHDRDFPNGAVGREAMALRIEVLVRSGDHARARALGETFLASHPTGAASRRVRTLLDSLEPKP